MEKRRSQRLKAVLPIKLFINSNGGSADCDLAHTLDVTRCGARLGSVRRQIQVGSVIAVQYQHRRTEFRVVWVKSLPAGNEHWIGLQSIEQKNVPWAIPGLALSGSTVVYRQTITYTHGKVLRAGEPQGPLPQLARPPRPKLNMTACVCQPGSEDIVPVLNMSRQGLCFESSREYIPETMIRIAAPYSPTGSANIFMIARIVWAKKNGTEPNRYGIEYVKSYSREDDHDESWSATIAVN